MSESFDTVVMGAGLAGCCAALSASEAGAKVLIAEKSEAPGGSSVRAAGTFAFSGTDLQHAAGIADTPDLLLEELIKLQGRAGNRNLATLYARDQLDTYAWLKQQGTVFERVQLSGGQKYPRAHAVETSRMIDALWTRLLARHGVTARTRTPIRRLRPAGGQWDVQLERNGHPSTVRASNIVIASGGFSRNRSLIAEFAPDLLPAVPISGPMNTGDGLEIGRALGARLVDMTCVKGTFGLPLPNYPELPLDADKDITLLLAIYRGAIVVNTLGQRFVDESASYKTIAERCLQQPGGIGLQIFDGTVMRQSVPVPATNDFRGALERGMVKRADSPAELARMLNLPPDALAATLAAYNDSIGTDAMGRTSLGGGTGKPFALTSPPFYGVPTAVAVTGTFCGLAVDTDMRVLDGSGRPLPGIFAAGEVVGGMHGESYMSGTGLGKAAIFGRIAGRNAARRRP